MIKKKKREEKYIKENFIIFKNDYYVKETIINRVFERIKYIYQHPLKFEYNGILGKKEKLEKGRRKWGQSLKTIHYYEKIIKINKEIAEKIYYQEKVQDEEDFFYLFDKNIDITFSKNEDENKNKYFGHTNGFNLEIESYEDNIDKIFKIDNVLNEYAHISELEVNNNNKLTITYKKIIEKTGKDDKANKKNDEDDEKKEEEEEEEKNLLALLLKKMNK